MANTTRRLIPKAHVHAQQHYCKLGATLGSSPPDYSKIFSDPISFDREAFNDLYRRYAPYLQAVLDNLLSGRIFVSVATDELFKKHLDVPLVCKQLLPLFATAEAFGKLDECSSDLVDFGQAYVVTKTTALNAIDTHIDLSISYNTKHDLAATGDFRTALLLAIASIFKGFERLNYCQGNSKTVAIVGNVFSHVMEIMLHDYCSRFWMDALRNPRLQIKLYEKGELNPLLGSGFYEATIRSALAIMGIAEGPAVKEFLHKFRKLRQLVDEIADVHEDIRVGRLTYPVLVGLSNSVHSKALASTIKQIWHKSKPIISRTGSDDLMNAKCLAGNLRLRYLTRRLYSLLEVAGAWQQSYDEADELYLDLIGNFSRVFPGAHPLGLVEIVTLKRAFLERLKHQEWRDVSLDPVEFPSAESIQYKMETCEGRLGK